MKPQTSYKVGTGLVHVGLLLIAAVAYLHIGLSAGLMALAAYCVIVGAATQYAAKETME